MATPLLDFTSSKLGGAKSPAAPKPVPKKAKKKPVTFLSASTELRSYQDTLKDAKKQYFASPPPQAKVLPKPGKMADWQKGGPGLDPAIGKRMWAQAQREYADSQRANAKWRKQREGEWKDLLSGKTQREARQKFLAPADKKILPGGLMQWMARHPGEDPVAAAKKLQGDERKKLEAEWNEMQRDPEAYSEKHSKMATEPVGKALLAGINLADFALPKSISNDLRILGAGFVPGIAETVEAGKDLAGGDNTKAKEMIDGMVQQYLDNYARGGVKGALSYAAQHPVLAGLDIAALAAPGAKVGSIGTIAARMMRLNPSLTMARALRMAQKESKLPGYGAVQGVEGGIKPRVLEGRTASTALPRPISKSPMGRTMQKGYDAFSRGLDRPSTVQLPGLKKLGTSARAAAANAKVVRLDRGQTDAWLAFLRDPVETYATEGGRANIKRLIGEAIPNKEAGAALVAALEAGTDVSTALKERIGALNNVLDNGIMWDRSIESPHRQEFIKTLNERFEPDEVAQLTTLTDHMALAQNPKNPAAWYEKNLAESSNLSANDFIRNGAAAAAAQFQTREGARLSLLDTGGRPDAQGRSTRMITRGEIDTQITAVSAAMKRGDDETTIFFRDKDGQEGYLTPNWHGGYEKHSYGDNRGSVALTDMEASQFLKNETDGPIWVGNQGARSAFEVPVFYSELQRQVEGMPDEGIPAKDLENWLKKRDVKPKEIKAMGIPAFIDRYEPNAKIPKEDIQDFLGDPLNAYNLDEIVRTSHTAQYNFQDMFGEGQYDGTLIARTATPDEPYFELTMTLGDYLPEQKQVGVGPYKGKGFSHWEQDNVIVHVRFHVITDPEGKRALLIDEIQSDWASEWRKKGKPEFDVDSEETLKRLAEIDKEMGELLRREREVFDVDAYRQARREFEDAYREYTDWPGGDPAEQEALWQASQEAISRYNDIEAEHIRVGPELKEIKGDISTLTRERVLIKRASKFVPPPFAEKEMDVAVRRMARWAAESDVDRIIIVPGEMQAYRNAAFGKLPDGKDVDLMRWHDKASEDQDNWRGAFEHMSTEELQDYGRSEGAKGSGAAPTYFRIYEEQIPHMFEKTMGVKGERKDHAFNGYYADQLHGLPEYGEQPMGGYVIDLTPESKALAMKPMALFQKQPNWNGLPRGATEFLGDSKTAMRLFDGAGVDTVVHELAHIALPDLPAADKAILAKHFGGEVDSWSKQQHEAFARGFEGYLYSGKAPTPELQQAFTKIREWIARIWEAMKQDPQRYLTPEVNEVFERMVLPKDRSPLNPEQRNYVHAQIKELEDALANLGDPQEMDAALVSMRKMSEMAEDHGKEIMLYGFDETPDPDTGISERDMMEDEIDYMLDRRRNAYTELLRQMGIIDPDDTTTRAAGYFPNLSIWRLGGEVPIAPTKIAATGNVLGVAQPRPDAINMNRNQFVRFQTGQLGMNPATMYDVLRMRIKHLTTLKLRQRLFDSGDPIKKNLKIEDIDEGLMFIRDQKQEAKKIREQTRAALAMDRDSYMALVERGEDPSGMLDEGIYAETSDDPKTAKELATDGVWWKGKEGPIPPWLVTEDTVRTVPRHVAEQLFGEVFPSAPKGGSLAPTVNALARMSLLYAPGPVPGSRYVTRNFAQNAVLAGMTHPTSLRHAVYATRKLGKEHPDLARMIDADAGSTRAEAALPEHYLKAQTKAQRRERNVTELQSNIGGALSAAADTPFRRSAWIGYAERYGFHGPEGWRRLLTDTSPNVERTRHMISQAVRDDLIDFDAMSEKERRFASQYFFLYPFVRGSLKWPFMFAREYPFRAGAIGALAGYEGQKREEEALAKTTSEAGRTTLKPGKKQYEFGWLDPFSPAAQTTESLAALMKGLSKNDYSAALQMLSPEYRQAVTALSGGASKTQPFGQMLRTFVPGYSTAEKWSRGGSLADQMLRHFGLSVEVSPSRKLQRKQAAADLVDAWQWAQKNGMDPDMEGVQKSARAYEKYQDLQQRVDFSQKDLGEGSLRKDDLTPAQALEREQQKALALTAAVAEGFPEQRESMTAQMKVIRKVTDLAQLQQYNEAMQEAAFAERNDLINTWKREKGG